MPGPYQEVAHEKLDIQEPVLATDKPTFKDHLLDKFARPVAALATVAALLPGAVPNSAYAETGPSSIVNIDESNTSGDIYSGPRVAIGERGSDGKPIIAMRAGQDIVFIHGGDSSFSSGNTAKVIAQGMGFGDAIDMVVPPGQNPVVFYGGEGGSYYAYCLDPACDTFLTYPLATKVTSIKAQVNPTGGVGLTFNTANQRLWHRQYNDISQPFEYTETLVDNRVTQEVGIDYTQEGQANLGYKKGADAMSAIVVDGVPLITAIDTQGEAGSNMFVISTPDGYRAAYQAKEYDEEGNYVGLVTRIGSAVPPDEQSENGGSASITVVSPNSGYDTALQLSNDGNSLILVQGTQQGLGIAECVKESPEQPTPDCITPNYSYQQILDASGQVISVDYKINPDNSAFAPYVIGNGAAAQLKVISGPDATFGIDLQAEGQQQQASSPRGMNAAGPSIGSKTPELTLPNLNGIKMSYDIRYVVGRAAVTTCGLGIDPSICDYLWHPPLPVNQ